MKKLILIFLSFLYVLNIFSQNTDFRIIIFDFEVAGSEVSTEDGQLVATSIRNNFSFLSKGSNVRVLERDEMILMLKDQYEATKLPDIYDSETAVKYGKIYQANYVVFGKVSTSILFDGYRISSRIVNVENGEIVNGFENSIKKGDDYDLKINEISRELISVTDNSIQSNLNKSRDDISEIVGGVFEVFRNDNRHMMYSSNEGIKKAGSYLDYLPNRNISDSIIGILYCVKQDAIPRFTMSEKKSDIFLMVFTDKGFYFRIDNKEPLYSHAGGMYWSDFIKLDIQQRYIEGTGYYEPRVTFYLQIGNEIFPPLVNCDSDERLLYSLFSQLKSSINQDR